MKKFILFAAVTGLLTAACSKPAEPVGEKPAVEEEIVVVEETAAQPPVQTAPAPTQEVQPVKEEIPANASRESILKRLPANHVADGDLFAEQLLFKIPADGPWSDQKKQFLANSADQVKTFTSQFCAVYSEQLHEAAKGMVDTYQDSARWQQDRQDFVRRMATRACRKAEVLSAQFNQQLAPAVQNAADRNALWEAVKPLEETFLKGIQNIRETYQLLTVSSLATQMPIHSAAQMLSKSGKAAQGAQLEGEYMAATTPYINEMVLIFESKAAADKSQDWEAKLQSANEAVNKQIVKLMQTVFQLNQPAPNAQPASEVPPPGKQPSNR